MKGFLRFPETKPHQIKMKICYSYGTINLGIEFILGLVWVTTIFPENTQKQTRLHPHANVSTATLVRDRSRRVPQQIQHGRSSLGKVLRHIYTGIVFCFYFPKPSITKSLLFHFPGDFSSVPSGWLGKAETCQKNAEPQ